MIGIYVFFNRFFCQYLCGIKRRIWPVAAALMTTQRAHVVEGEKNLILGDVVAYADVLVGVVVFMGCLGHLMLLCA